MSPEESLDEFYEEIPALGLLGTPHPIYASTPYVVDKDVQLVCKYLKEYKAKGIDKLYRDGKSSSHVMYAVKSLFLCVCSWWLSEERSRWAFGEV